MFLWKFGDIKKYPTGKCLMNWILCKIIFLKYVCRFQFSKTKKYLKIKNIWCFWGGVYFIGIFFDRSYNIFQNAKNSRFCPRNTPGHPRLSFIGWKNIKMQSFYFQNLLPTARQTFFSRISRANKLGQSLKHVASPIGIILLKIIIILLNVLSLRKTNSRIKCSVDLKNYRKTFCKTW